jgi:hypothetical protein
VKRTLGLLLLLVAGACAPDIAQDPAPPLAIIVQFDPGASVPVVPVPNDLAKDPETGKIVVPPKEGETAAQREFNESYIGTLDGFPFESTAEVLLTGDVDAETVTPKTVLVLDITKGAVAVTAAPRYDTDKLAISVPPPKGGWLRAHRYAVAIIGGDGGIRGARGEAVVGSATWALVSGTDPLVECFTPEKCAPAVDIIPSDKKDPHEKFEDQTAKAKRLDELRKGYAPLLDGIAAKGIPREDIALLWTFSILDAGEATFDPSNNVIPFPNDVVRPEGKVTLPNPKTGKPLTAEDCKQADLQIQLTCGLNTLDGFSTLTAPISENSNTLGALAQASIDPKTLTTKSVGLTPVSTTAPEGARTAPKYTPCVSCLSSKDATGAPQPLQQLQWKLDAPLDERTTYLGYVTNAVRDDKGKRVVATPVFALLRSVAPLVEDGKATVSILSDAQANQLEPLRAALAPAFDALETAGVPRASLVLGFPFTTQSEATLLEQLHGLPAKIPGLPPGPTFVIDATAQLTAAAGAAGIPVDGIAKFYVGAFLSPNALTGPGGTLNPTKPQVQRVDFSMAIPSTPAPAGGYPTTIFGHGFTRSRSDFLSIANSLAKAGQVTIASDVLFHGERTSCTGSKSATKQASDDAACRDPATQKCNGDALLGLCISRTEGSRNACAPGPAGDNFCAGVGQGRCAPDLKCQNGDLARDPTNKPLISGWNIFSLTNFFATRDNLRQQVIDLSQLVRVIKSVGPTGLGGQAGGITLDGARLGYVGQSLGGILGTLFNAVSPDTNNVVLNVPGGALPQIILTAASFAEQKATLLGVLSSQGITPGMPAFDQFIGVIQWILDPADPANMGYRLTHGVDSGGVRAPNTKRKTFIQFIEGDQTVPNVSNLALVAGANRTFKPTPPSLGCVAPLFCYEFTEKGDGFDATTATPGSRHGFLLAPPAGGGGLALTGKAQAQAATFLATGALP